MSSFQQIHQVHQSHQKSPTSSVIAASSTGRFRRVTVAPPSPAISWSAGRTDAGSASTAAQSPTSPSESPSSTREANTSSRSLPRTRSAWVHSANHHSPSWRRIHSVSMFFMFHPLSVLFLHNICFLFFKTLTYWNKILDWFLYF